MSGLPVHVVTSPFIRVSFIPVTDKCCADEEKKEEEDDHWYDFIGDWWKDEDEDDRGNDGNRRLEQDDFDVYLKKFLKEWYDTESIKREGGRRLNERDVDESKVDTFDDDDVFGGFVNDVIGGKQKKMKQRDTLYKLRKRLLVRLLKKLS